NFAIEPQLAVAALLVHLAAVDGVVTDIERATLKGALTDHYGLDENEVDKLIADATRRDAESVDFYRFTSAISSLPDEEKLGIVRMMWQVVYSDSENHELEDNMVWRIAELIHVSSRDRTVLRNQMARGKP
ncbi:MAG TPA: TerB family tellurite resistance protein, partial [Devosia sp.]|nr:TerB family tellurite resistance protein [Devosia sp.]